LASLSNWINVNKHEWAYLPGNLAEIYFAGRKGGMQTCIQVPNAFLKRGKV